MSTEKLEKTKYSPVSDSKEAQESKESAEEAQENDADTTCGFWILKGPRLQRLANENAYVIIFGLAGCFMAMSFAYFTGTLTTLEKRFKIPTKILSLITVGCDVSITLFSVFLAYYTARRHRPHWIAVGLVFLAGFCLLSASPHFLYGAGEDALKLTRQYANTVSANSSQSDVKLCQSKEKTCYEEKQWTPIFLLFSAQFVSGIGCTLFYTLGLSYMDDNIAKSKTPAMLSWSSFLRMLGPAMGYSMASVCLRYYIDPSLDPLISNEDTRWLGAWWIGWILLTVIMLFCALSLYVFPKELPSSRARRLKLQQDGKDIVERETSLRDMLKAVKRLGSNKVFVFNTLASTFYFFGYVPYWVFTPKYIETQYKQSASTAAMATGTVALGFSAAGILISGYVISKFKPSARAMAAWNGIVDILTVAGILCYVFIGCADSDKAKSQILDQAADSCSASCHCEYVHYDPICSPQNITYISACHAGCSDKIKDELGRLTFTGCKCITPLDIANVTQSQYATQGPCPFDCYNEFLVFLGVMCILKFIGASGRSSNMLLSLRCVPPEDKSFSLGLGNVVLCVVCFIPSPILFGWIIDNYCLVWGKTCGSTGNCWLYDTESLRFTINVLAASCIFIGSLWNIGVWYYAKDIKIFDDEDKEKPITEISDEEFQLMEKPTDTKIN